jgi:DNA-directed RNA polymerase specialized sigma24 family protein
VADGWDVLVAERERLVETLRRRSGVHVDAEDWAHDAMLRVASVADVDEARVGGLLVTVGWRIGIDALRAQRRHRRIASRLVVTSIAAADHVAVGNQAAGELLMHVDTLPRRQRDVFLMVAGGVSLREAGRALGMSYKAAESALARARVRLRACVATD